MSEKTLKLINEIEAALEVIPTMPYKEYKAVYEIYKNLYNRAASLDKSDITDSWSYKAYSSYFKHNKQNEIVLGWLKKGSTMATSHKYLQVTYELGGILSFIKSMSDYYDELRFRLSNPCSAKSPDFEERV